MKTLAAASMLLVALIGARQDAVPVRNEPHHHFKFENEFVRVYDVVVEPGDATYGFHGNWIAG